MPKPGVFSAKSIDVSTGALTAYSLALAPSWIASHAPTTSMRPAPCSCAFLPAILVAVEVSAVRSFAGVSSIPFCLAAESSSALAPVACGEAIEVPWSIE